MQHSECEKPVMVIVTTLFFNRIGNQSLLETVKQYAKKYRIIFITAASKYNSYYMDEKNAKLEFESDLIFYRVYQIIPNLFRYLKGRLSCFKMKTKKTTVAYSDTALQNAVYSKVNLISAQIAGWFLYYKLNTVIKKYNPCIVCAYEVFAVPAVIKAKKRFSTKKIKYLAKFQGTVLGFDYKNNNFPLLYKKYKPDIDAFRLCNKFDVCAITNDGTNGKQVLEFFGVASNKILYEPNGISNYIQEIKTNIRIDNAFDDGKTINLFTLSRLIGWKRVYLSIEIINKLVNVFHNTRYFLNIYGYGTKDENDTLMRLIDSYHLHNYVCIHGAVAHTKLVEVYNKNHIMLSLYKYTNVTNPVIEALYLYKPVITLHDDNLDFLLKDINTNRVFIYKDLGDEYIVEQIAVFLNNTIFQFEQANERLQNIFNWERRIQRELALLQKP